jgi:D-alanine-D-alanine ligase
MNAQTELHDFEKFMEPLYQRLRIAVVYGGDQAEDGTVIYRTRNTRGTKTYEAVARDIAASLQKLGFQNVMVLPEDMRLPDRLRDNGIHLTWLNTGGIQGYNPMAHGPSLMEMLGVPYVGHNPLSATILDNKHAFKRELREAGLPTSAFLSWDVARGPLIPTINSRFKDAFGDYQGPFIVKPISGRASIHVNVVPSIDQLQAMVAEVSSVAQNIVLIERFLPGREFVAAVSGPIVARSRRLVRQPAAFAFSLCERVLDKDEMIFTSMDKKPITTDRVRLVDPKEQPELHEQLVFLAQRTYLHFNLETLVRLDIRADENGELHILEANPKPDLARPKDGKLSLACAGLPSEGMDYEDLVLSLIAGRLYYLAMNRPESVEHILALSRPELMNLEPA